jgi:hypothetical protein
VAWLQFGYIDTNYRSHTLKGRGGGLVAQRRPNPGSSGQQKRVTVEVAFEKASQWRTVHIDGAWGGVAQDGGVAASVYSDHRGTPARMTYEVEQGAIPSETARTGGETIMREVEVELRMAASVARAFGQWLLTKADEADEIDRRVRSANTSETKQR